MGTNNIHKLKFIQMHTYIYVDILICIDFLLYRMYFFKALGLLDKNVLDSKHPFQTCIL